jgi:hypothetical protein
VRLEKNMLQLAKSSRQLIPAVPLSGGKGQTTTRVSDAHTLVDGARRAMCGEELTTYAKQAAIRLRCSVAQMHLETDSNKCTEFVLW